MKERCTLKYTNTKQAFNANTMLLLEMILLTTCFHLVIQGER